MLLDLENLIDKKMNLKEFFSNYHLDFGKNNENETLIQVDHVR